MAMRRGGVVGAVLILLMCGVCVRLGFWQLSRLEQRRAANAVATRGLAAPPVPLDAAAAARVVAEPAAWRYRRVTATGRFLAPREVVLRGRSEQGRPGVHLVTPLRMEGGGILLVNRGWVPAADGVRPGERPPPPPGEVSVQGVLMEIAATADRGAPLVGADGAATYRRLDLAESRARLGDALLPLVLNWQHQRPLPRALPPPVVNDGPHLSYALQWFGFAATGVIGLLILLLRGRRA